jgi:hypothetical protein
MGVKKLMGHWGGSSPSGGEKMACTATGFSIWGKQTSL